MQSITYENKIMYSQTFITITGHSAACCYGTECEVPGTKTVSCKEPGCQQLVHHLCFDSYWRKVLPDVEPPEGGATDAYCK